MSAKTIDIEGSLTIERVGALQEIMRTALAHHADSKIIEMRLSGVTEFDGAGLQLLLAYAQAIERMDAQLVLHSVPASIQNILDRYGVASRFTNKRPA